MAEYPNREHENADKAARRRALHALREIETSVGILRRRLQDDKAEPDGDDTQRIASLVRDLTQHHAVLGALRDVREWHVADQAEKAESGQAKYAAMPSDARPYAGQRHCLFCAERALWDLAGFLACGDTEHVARAAGALDARREQEDAAEEGAAAELNQADSDAT
jgi:hypothetical protein